MRITVAGIVAIVLVGTMSAQHHPGPVTTGSGTSTTNPLTMTGQLFIDKDTGAISTFVDTTQPPVPMGMLSISYDTDNRSIIFGTGGNSGNFQLLKGVYRRDGVTGRYSTIVKSDDLWRVWNLRTNSDNDLIVGAGTNYEKLFRVTTGGRLTTLTPGGQWYIRPELSLDVATGNILVRTYAWGVMSYLVLGVSVDGSWDLYYRSQWPLDGLTMTERLADGYFYFAASGGIHRWRRGMTQPALVTRLPLVGPEQAVDLVFDNQTAAKPRALVLTSARNPLPPNQLYGQRLLHLDPASNFAVTKIVDVVRLSSTPVAQPAAAELYNHQSRYVSSEKTAPGKWRLNVNFPTRPGKRYVLVAGYSGIRPGLTLGDGRTVWLNADPLLALTSANGVGPMWNPGPGVLDAAGSAAGQIDVSSLPAPLNVTIHLVAAIVDPSAPLGIAFITEPHPMQL